MERIRVTASKEYEVVIGKGVLSRAGEEISPLVKAKIAAIISDDITSQMFSATVKESVEAQGIKTVEFIIPHGESSKSAENYMEILEFLADNKLTRADCIIALGGGVVGDLAGFVAATYLRGIDFVQIPTTLLSAVDSSVGGKTAINLSAGKNLAGAFYQPRVVLCDTEIIGNLPDEIFADGMAEVIKYGAIRNAYIFELIERGAHENLDELIAECVRIKRDVVGEDEFDTGLRQLLNFGHTPAHTIEKLSGYEVSHGRAVAAGMCIMSRAAEKLGLCHDNVSGEIEKMCTMFGLPTSVEYTPRDMADIAMSDKKRGAGYITLVVPQRRGFCTLNKVPESEIEKYFGAGSEAKR